MGMDVLGIKKSCDERSCEMASTRGQLVCLIYLHENGCPWNEQCRKYASLNGHLDCENYLQVNGCPDD